MLLLTISANAYSFEKKYYNHPYHLHSASSYQHAYCSAINGIEEYQLPDKTRVDCLTNTHAIEFDFVNKWSEAIGQALYYGLITGMKPKVVLILDKNCKNNQIVYYERVKKLGQVYNIDTEYISDDILDIDNNGRCQYQNCKCNRKTKKILQNGG